MIDQIAELFVKLPKDQQIHTLNVLAHLLPTAGVNYNSEEEGNIEHVISMLQKALTLNEYVGPSREKLLAQAKLLVTLYSPEEIAEMADEPGATYVNPDKGTEEVSEEAEIPNLEEAKK